jgi:hypothetical protein
MTIPIFCCSSGSYRWWLGSSWGPCTCGQYRTFSDCSYWLGPSTSADCPRLGVGIVHSGTCLLRLKFSIFLKYECQKSDGILYSYALLWTLMFLGFLAKPVVQNQYFGSWIVFFFPFDITMYMTWKFLVNLKTGKGVRNDACYSLSYSLNMCKYRPWSLLLYRSC